MQGDNYATSSEENKAPQEESELEESLRGKFILDGAAMISHHRRPPPSSFKVWI